MKVLLVSGGSRGIGEAIVRKAVEKYAVVFFYQKSDEKAQKLAFETGATAIKCDVSSSAEVKKCVGEVLQKFKHIDALVNNAGVSLSRLFQDTTDDEWRHVFGVNTDGTFFVTREVVKDMIARGDGAIVNVSSMWGEQGASMEVAYSASKSAVIGLTKALSKELAPSHITVNAVAPGAVDTDMMKEYSDEDVKAFCEEIPLGRLATPDEIADGILFLLEQKYITGQVLSITGGY